jgi:hypothetical protein
MLLKKILPFENYLLKTNLSADEVLGRIKNSIENKKPFRFSILKDDYTKPYTGQIIGRTFKMTRNINYRNSFLPNIYGQITSFLGITTVKIKMRPNMIVLAFISLWLGTVGLICITILFGVLFKSKFIAKDTPLIALFMPFLMFATVYLMTYFGFKVESKKSKKFLDEILENIDT